MPNNSFQDVIPPSGSGRRSIRDIPIPTTRQNKIDNLLEETAEFRAEEKKKHTHSPVPPPPRPPKIKKVKESGDSSRKGIWVIATLSVAVLVVAFYILFSPKAEITVALKTESIPVDVVATSTSDSSSSGLIYKVIPIQKTDSVDITTSGTPQQVDKKATGTIIIYNNYTTASQQLIATTRFATASGLIFHLDKAVTIPGTKVVAGKTVPGSIEATVTADQSGDQYNVDKTDFTIPGFQGSAKYQGFYGRGKTAMTGGFSGKIGQVSDADLKTANDNLKASLTNQALQDVATSTPDGYVFLQDGVQTTYSSSLGASTDGKATLTGKLTLQALVFDQSSLEDLITQSLGQQYHFDNLNSLGLTLTNMGSTTSFISNPILNVELKGTLTSGQSFDTDALKKTLSGKSKNQLQEILKLYPEVIKAEAVVHPFWSTSFPNNVKNIKVTVTK